MEANGSKKNAFTLTEVIVVMSIIAVLATLVMSAIVVAKKNSTNTQRVTIAQKLETTLDAYADNHKGNFFYAPAFETSLNGFVQTINSYVSYSGWEGYQKYMKSIPEGLTLATVAGKTVAADSNNNNFFYISYNGSATEKNNNESPHYILAVCGVGGNASNVALSMDVSKYKTATKSDVTNCSNVIYFVRK